MKFLLILALLVGIECFNLKSLRNQLTLEKSTIIKFMKATALDEFVNDKLEDSNLVENVMTKTVSKYLEDCSTIFTSIDIRFGRTVLGYIKKRLLVYLSSIRTRIDDFGEESKDVPQEFIDEIKFDINQDFCVVPFLFNYGIDVEIIFRTIFFLKTFHLTSSRITLHILFIHISMLAEFFYTKSDNGYNLSKNALEDENEIEESIKNCNLKELTDQILIFSNKFCSPEISPIVSNDLLYRDELVYKDDEIIGFIMKNEMCSIYISRSIMPKVYGWNCEDILIQDEFEMRNYLKFVQVERTSTKWIRDRSPEKIEMIKYSLMEYKQLILKENYCINIVIYNNIASDNMQSVSVKIGLRILKAIKKWFADNSEDPKMYSITKDDVDMMRSKLFMFKSYYDSFMYIVREKIPQVVTIDHSFVSKFDKYVNFILNTLAYSKTQQWDEYLVDARKKVAGVLVIIDDAQRGEIPDKFRFQQFYLNRPVLHMYKIHNYALLHFQ